MKYKLSLLVFMMFLFSFSSSQEISNVDFSINNKKIYTSFTVQGIEKSPTFSYDFCIKVLRKNNPEIIIPVSISGDIKGITTNGNKLIIWDVLSDIEFLEGEFKVEVYICNKNLIPIQQTYTPSKFKPAKKSKNFLAPILLVGLGAGSKFYSSSSYKSYLAATTQNDMDRYYNTANTFNKVFVVTAGTGILWGLVKLMSKGKPSYTKLNFSGSSLVYTINQKK
jgi:hypothetical protein